eukprot:jgi/Ulvmu1/3145/UM015_0185.1
MAGKSVDKLSTQLKDLVMEGREERLARHCMAVTQAMLSCPDHLKGVMFKCNDDAVLAAHKFVLGIQAPYYRQILYREGVMNTSVNSLMNKKYRFWGSSTCFRYLMQFLYTGAISELEEAGAIDGHIDDIDELLTLALQPKKDGLGGVDKYLIGKLCQNKPRSIKAAMARLCMGMNNSIQEIVDAMRDVIPKLEFTVDCFNVADLNTEVVELVLRDIPLNAIELDVCRCVHAWAQEFFGIDSDEDTDELPEDQASDDLLILPPEDRRILKHIDLSCVSASEIREVVNPMRLFPRTDVVDAQRKHAINRTGNLPSRKNATRGSDEAGSDNSVVQPLNPA